MHDTTSLAGLVRAWLPGWGRCRKLITPVRDTGTALWVRMERPDRYFEAFALCADSDPGSLGPLAARVAGAHRTTWLTVPTSHPERVRKLVSPNGLETFSEPESLMSVDWPTQAEHDPPRPYRCRVECTGGVHLAKITTPTGELAASGMAAAIGDVAVAHGIVTNPQHRRRGLGGAVMSALGRAVVADGAGTGLLMASPAGAGLYRSLGWTRHATVLCFRPGRSVVGGGQ